MTAPEIDDDVFNEAGEHHCISGHGRHAVREIMQYFDERATADDVERGAGRYIDELVRWCRNFNGETQRQAASLTEKAEQLAAVRKQLAEITKAAKDVCGSIGRPTFDSCSLPNLRAAVSALQTKDAQ